MEIGAGLSDEDAAAVCCGCGCCCCCRVAEVGDAVGVEDATGGDNGGSETADCGRGGGVDGAEVGWWKVGGTGGAWWCGVNGLAGGGAGAGKAVGGKEGWECGRGWTAGKAAGCERNGGREGCWAVEEDGVEVESDGSSVSLEREIRFLSINTAGVGRGGGDDAQHSCRACER